MIVVYYFGSPGTNFSINGSTQLIRNSALVFGGAIYCDQKVKSTAQFATQVCFASGSEGTIVIYYLLSDSNFPMQAQINLGGNTVLYNNMASNGGAVYVSAISIVHQPTSGVGPIFVKFTENVR